MPTITREDTDVLTAIFTVKIAKEDYQKQVNKKLNDFRKKAHLKGFRKGQVPMSYVKKLYGKAVIADELNELSYKSLMEYIAEHKITTFGQPLPVEDQIAPDLEARNYIDYEFQYEVGLNLSFEVKGLDKSTEVDNYEVEVTDVDIQKEIDRFRKERGTQEVVDEVKLETDLLSVNLIELENDEPKEEGINKFSMVAIEDIEDEELKKHILTLKKSDTFDTDVHKLVSKEQAKNIRKQFLYVSEETEFNDTFRVEIQGITSMIPADLNAQLLIDAIGMEKAEKYIADFLPEEEIEEVTEDSDLDILEVVDLDLGMDEEGEDADNEEKKAVQFGFMEELRIMLEEQYKQTSQTFTFTKIFDKLKDLNKVELPDAYLRRWLEFASESKVGDIEFEASIAYLRDTMLIEQIAKDMDVYVSEADIEAEMRQDYYERANVNPDDPKAEKQFQEFYKMMLQYDEAFMSKRQSTMNRVKIEEKIGEVVTFHPKKVSTNEFNDIVEAEREARRKKAEEEKVEETEKDNAEAAENTIIETELT